MSIRPAYLQRKMKCIVLQKEKNLFNVPIILSFLSLDLNLDVSLIKFHYKSDIL